MTRSPTNPLLYFSILQPPTLNTGFQSSSFSSELFTDEALHLPDSLPKFQMISLKTWYRGLPLSVLSYVVNDKQLPLYSCFLTIKIKDQFGQIIEKTAPAILSLEPGKIISLRVDFIPPRENQATLECVFKYQLENSSYTMRKKLNLDIKPSVLLEYKAIQQSSLNLIHFTIKNMLPFILYDVNVATEVNDNVNIEQHLNPHDIYNGILNITRPYNSLTVSFTPRNFLRAFTTIQCKQPKQQTQPIINVKLNGIPQEWPALKPFTINLQATNTSDKNLSGKIVVAELNDSIFVYGNNDLTFKDFKPQETKDFSIEFVAVKEGTYKFPVFDFFVDSLKSFRVNNTEGIIVVGFNDDEKH